MESTATQVKSTTSHGAPARPENLCARAHGRPTRVVPPWREVSMLGHRTIYRPVAAVPTDVAITPVRQGGRYSPGGVACVAIRSAEHVGTLGVGAISGYVVVPGIGAIPEEIVMRGISTVPERLASSRLVGTAETLRHGGVAVRHVATMCRVMLPDVIGDVDVGAVENVEAVDIDDDVVIPPVAAAPDRSADRDTRSNRDHVAGGKAGLRAIER